MHADRLPADTVAALRAAPFTYPEVGHTAGEPPSGYRTIDRTVTLPAATDFDHAVRDLFEWRVHQRSGLRVAASGPITPDAVVVLSLGLARFVVRAPCRVAYVVTEPDRQGFAYGTLPGHPERGEEAFMLHRHLGGTVTFAITAFSRPSGPLATIAGPFGRRVQDLITSRYLRALG
ncbi:MAG TPA: DUF1990 domain-containing protein [Actinokineospora sp.]|nr:DUF1990 domain-containing protein [Actinokineospora sp.]